MGYGRHSGAKLYPAFLLAGAHIVSVLTRSAASAEKAAAELGAEHAYHDIDRMLADTALDAVVICVQPEDQAALTLRCLQAGLPVFVEKPLGMSGADARKVATAAKEHDVPVMVGFMKRFAPAYERLAELLADPEKLGRLLTVDATFSFAPWTTDLRVNSFLQQGAIHMIDLLLAVFGEAEIEAGQSNSAKSDIGLVYTLRFPDGSVASLTLSATQAREDTFERVTAVATKGWVTAENLDSVSYRFEGQTGTSSESWTEREDFAAICHSDDPNQAAQALDLCREGFYGEARHFMQRVSSNKPLQASAAENVTTMVLCDELREIL